MRLATAVLVEYTSSMGSSAAKRSGDDPVSVILPARLKSRVAREAKRRGLKLSPTIRVLVGERLEELEESEALDRALAWQRHEAWATWERIRGGERPDVGFDALEADFERALPKRRTR